MRSKLPEAKAPAMESVALGAAFTATGAGLSGALWLVAGVAGVVVWRTRIHLLWLLGAGALLGALGFA